MTPRIQVMIPKIGPWSQRLRLWPMDTLCSTQYLSTQEVVWRTGYGIGLRVDEWRIRTPVCTEAHSVVVPYVKSSSEIIHQHIIAGRYSRCRNKGTLNLEPKAIKDLSFNLWSRSEHYFVCFGYCQELYLSNFCVAALFNFILPSPHSIETKKLAYWTVIQTSACNMLTVVLPWYYCRALLGVNY